MKLTQEQINSYHQQGYLTLPPITTNEEIAKLRTIYDRLFADQVGRAEGNQFDLAGADEDGAVATLGRGADEKFYSLIWRCTHVKISTI